MSLNDLELPGHVIQSLFQHVLVDSEKAGTPSVSTAKEMNFFGGYKQQVILLVNNPDAAFVSDQELSFLSGILNACKLTLEDIAILNIAKTPAINYKQITEKYKPRIIMMFGVEPAILGLPFVMPEFQRQSYNNQVYLSAPALPVLENNKDLKRKLWTALQQVFSL
jgi:hypothetical protein